MFPGFIQTKAGMIASVAVGLTFWIVFTNMADQSKSDVPAGDSSAIVSGPLQLIIVETEQLGDGVLIHTEITNLSDKPVKQAQVILAAKDEFQSRIMSEEVRLIPKNEPSLAPGESIELEIFLWDMYLEEIKFYTFRAAFVTYDEV